MKLESLKNYKKLNKATMRNVVGGDCTSVYSNTSVQTNGGKDTGNNPNDWSHFKEDGSNGCPPRPTTDTLQTKQILA